MRLSWKIISLFFPSKNIFKQLNWWYLWHRWFRVLAAKNLPKYGLERKTTYLCYWINIMLHAAGISLQVLIAKSSSLFFILLSFFFLPSSRTHEVQAINSLQVLNKMPLKCSFNNFFRENSMAFQSRILLIVLDLLDIFLGS